MEAVIDMQAIQEMIAGNAGVQAKRDRRVIQFDWFAVEDHSYFKENGVVRFIDDIYVKIFAPGEKSVVHRKATDKDKAMFPIQWAAFQMLQGGEKQDGFPILQWHGCTKAQAETLFRNGIKTVETLAETSDPEICKFGQSYPGLKIAAIAHIEMAEGSADINKLRSDCAHKVETIRTLKSKVRALEKKLKEKKDENTS